LDGGANHADNPVVYTIESPKITLRSPTRQGYTFTDWAEGDTIPAGSTGDRTFTAQWTVSDYAITYILGDGGTNHADNPATYSPTGDKVVLKDPTREGYDFTGWAEGDTIPAGSAGDKTFTAQWSAIAYGITYELNGGANHADNPVTYTIESAAIRLQAPAREGYEFTGWTEGDTIPAGSVGDKTFTAQWSAIVYGIIYELNGGDNHADNPNFYTVESAISLQNPDKYGYDFAGWTEGSGIETGSTGDRTFTARWLPTIYGINYELDGGTNHADNSDSYTIEDVITLQNPFREGFIFEGWAEGNTITVGSTGDKTFTALWKCVEANIEEIVINGSDVSALSAINDSVFEYIAQECDESSISLDLGVSSQATVTVNGKTYAPGMEIPFEGDLTIVDIRVESETGDNNKPYTLNIAAPLNVSALYYQRWNDVIAVNQNPATNGGYDVSDIRWYKRDGTPAGEGDFISIGSAEGITDYYSEVKTTETNAWHRVCPTEETRSLDKIVAYPNPVPQGEKVTVKLPESYVNGVLNIYDIRGGLVKSGLPLPTTVNSVDISELVPGIYLLRITDKQGKSETIKIVKN
jgi:uncharacterized repeat protein (TIGR02543 family)